MKYRKLGSTSFSVSEIGLGTAQLSNTDNNFRGVKYVPIEEARKILSAAIEKGVNIFDTGANYGNAESILKEVKQKIFGGIFCSTDESGSCHDFAVELTKEFLKDKSILTLDEKTYNLFRN